MVHTMLAGVMRVIMNGKLTDTLHGKTHRWLRFEVVRHAGWPRLLSNRGREATGGQLESPSEEPLAAAPPGQLVEGVR